MPGVDIWPVVHSERSALASDLAALTEEQWSTPSLCSTWSVRDVLAHMTATAKVTPASFFPKLIGSGFSFDRMQAKDIAAESGSSGADTLSRFEGAQGHHAGRDHRARVLNLALLLVTGFRTAGAQNRPN